MRLNENEVPKKLQDICHLLADARKDLLEELGREPSMEEILIEAEEEMPDIRDHVSPIDPEEVK